MNDGRATHSLRDYLLDCPETPRTKRELDRLAKWLPNGKALGMRGDRGGFAKSVG